MVARTDGLLRSDATTEVERPWMELVEHLGVVAARDELVDRGVTPAKAAAVAMWLHDQLERRRLLSAPTVSGYRQALREVGCPPSDPQVRGSRSPG